MPDFIDECRVAQQGIERACRATNLTFARPTPPERCVTPGAPDRWPCSIVIQEDESEMRARTLAALMAVLLFAWPVAAQEQRSSIEGVIRDSSGAVLPGATVAAKSVAGTFTSVTDGQGIYRFP